MSNAVFPSFPGLNPSVTKTPQWKTRVQRTVSGRETRLAMYSTPIWKFSLSFEVLRQGTLAEIESLMGFYNLRQGSFDTFLFTDPTDNSVAAQSFGTGDGSTKVFKLLHTFGGYTEVIGAVNGAPGIYIAGVLQGSGYVISGDTVTFTTAPANGAALTWTGNFYYRVRFADETMDFEQFLSKLWQAKKVELVTVKS